MKGDAVAVQQGRVRAELHLAQPWRLGELAPEFRLEDAWALPAFGNADDFARLPAALAEAAAQLGRESRLSQALFAVRKVLGAWFGWDKEPAPGAASRAAHPQSLAARLPDDLRPEPHADLDQVAPFRMLFVTGNEWTAEIINKTVHGVAQLTWIPVDSSTDQHADQHALPHRPPADQRTDQRTDQQTDQQARPGVQYQGRLAVYVKPRGGLGAVYMAGIKPFRLWIVYPALLRAIGRAWSAQ